MVYSLFVFVPVGMGFAFVPVGYGFCVGSFMVSFTVSSRYSYTGCQPLFVYSKSKDRDYETGYLTNSPTDCLYWSVVWYNRTRWIRIALAKRFGERTKWRKTAQTCREVTCFFFLICHYY